MDFFNELDRYINEIKERISASAAICVIKDNRIVHE